MSLDNILMMNKKKAILIIGATGGVGKLLSQEFKNNGYYVIGNGRKEEVLKEMKEKNIIDEYIVGDLTNENDRKRIIEKIKELSNNYDVKIFYNLGVLYEYPGDLSKYGEKQILQSFNTNILSIMYMDNELLKERIILDTIYMVSISAFYRGEWDYLYQITKAALKSYIETLIVDDMKNGRNRKIKALFPDTIKTGEEGMGSKLENLPKIPGDIFAKEVVRIVNEKDEYSIYGHIGYIFEIEGDSIKIYGINPDVNTGAFEYYRNKISIKELGKPVY